MDPTVNKTQSLPSRSLSSSEKTDKGLVSYNIIDNTTGRISSEYHRHAKEELLTQMTREGVRQQGQDKWTLSRTDGIQAESGERRRHQGRQALGEVGAFCHRGGRAWFCESERLKGQISTVSWAGKRGAILRSLDLSQGSWGDTECFKQECNRDSIGFTF